MSAKVTACRSTGTHGVVGDVNRFLRGRAGYFRQATPPLPADELSPFLPTQRTILVEILGLPVSARADAAKPHDVRTARDLLRDSLDGLPRVAAIVADRGYRGLRALAERHNLRLDSKAPPQGQTGFHPDRAALQDRARLRPARPLAPAVALL